jgi:peroxiredoxin
MAHSFRHRVLVAGIFSPVAAALLGALIYTITTRASSDLNHDFVFRLTMVIVGMTVPFFLTLVLAFKDSRNGWNLSKIIGLGIAILSLCLTLVPLRGLMGRLNQARNVSAQGVSAPVFDTKDVDGKSYRLQDHLGQVVLINAWATWCPPCRKEMPDLNRLYKKRKQEGLIVFGISTEDAELQRKFVNEQIHVTYPLLTINGNVPTMYVDIQRWPALFLIDRQGRLQPVAQAGEPFEKVEAAVDALLTTN